MQCLKCKHDVFDKDVVIGRILDAEAKYNKSEDDYEVLNCKQCHLIQWYDGRIVSGEKRPERRYGESIYRTPELKPFRCFNCQNELFTTERIGPVCGGGAWEGEIALRICLKCGLAEMYDTGLVGISDGNTSIHVIRLNERIALAKGFQCPACGVKTIHQSGLVDFYKRLHEQPRYNSSVIEIGYLFCSCEKCRHMLFFSGYLE